MPLISDGEYTFCFPPVVIDGRLFRTGRNRHLRITGHTAGSEEALILRRGGSLRYERRIPLQNWMHGATLFAEILSIRCGKEEREKVILVGNVLPVLPPVATSVHESGSQTGVEIPTVEEITVAEELSRVLTFVHPASEFYAHYPARLYDEDRDEAITVYFLINSYAIDPEYAGNRQSLRNLTAAIELITSSLDSRVSRVFVAGFASPDGPHQLNDRLAWERAVSVKRYILDNTPLADSLVTVYNGSADW